MTSVVDKTLLLSDLHLRNNVPVYLKSQIDALTNIVVTERPDEIIIMGDVFMHRRPSPTVLIEFRNFLETCKTWIPDWGSIHILRGNHDSETKADDGITALSLYEEKDKIYVHKHLAGLNPKFKCSGITGQPIFIPHYEDQELLDKILGSLPNDSIIFGHFGYSGCLNSLGDRDFNVSLDSFNNRTYLGHIHKYSSDGVVTVLGTHYTTNFGEAGKENYYGVFEEGKFKLKLSNKGPKHIIAYYTDEYFIETLDIPEDNFVLLRIFIDPITQKINSSKLKMDIMNKWPNIHSIDINYKSALEDFEDYKCEDEISPIFSVDESLIRKYVDDNSANIPNEDLMAGYYLLAETLNDTR